MKVYHAGVALATIMSPLFLLAEGSGYVTLTADASYKEGYGFAVAKWSEDVEDPSVTDYLVTNGKIFSSAYKEDSIPARSITFGEVGGGKGYYRAYYSVAYTGSGGLVFANGKCWTHLASTIINGNLTVMSPKEDPFLIYSDGYRGGLLQFTGNLKSDENCGVVVHSGFYNTTEGNKPFTLEFTGNVRDYLGSMIVTSRYDSVGDIISTTLKLSGSATYFGGSMTFGDGAVFNPHVATSVGSLTLKSGARLDLSSMAALAVRDNLTIEKDAVLNMYLGTTLTVGKVLSLPESPLTINLSGMPESAVTEITRYGLITLPAESDCTVSDFAVVEEGVDSFYTKAKLEFVLSEDGETKTLLASYFPLVTNILDNNVDPEDSEAESAESHGKYWSDGNSVHSGAHYRIVKLSGTTCFSTRYAPQKALSFAGESLTLTGFTFLSLRTGDFSVPYMRFICGDSGATVQGIDGENHILRSKFEVSGRVKIEPKKGGYINLTGPIAGTESSKLIFRGESASTSTCRGLVELDGDNTGYAGKMQVTLEYPEKLKFNSQFTSLMVRRADNLGGPRSEFAFDALQIDVGSRLEVLDSFAMSEPTRGIFISGIGRMLVESEKALTVKQQLTVNGKLYKEGAGTLALGGDLRFIDTEGAVTAEIPEDATNRTFYVTGGKVKPLTAHALDGLDVVFSNKTSKLDVGLVLDMDTEDEELRAKGICNVKSPSPLAFLDDDQSKKITLFLVRGTSAPAESYSFGVMTVKTECADALDLLKIIPPESLSHLKLTTDKVVDSAAGTVTLTATMKRYGFVVSIR